LSQRELADRLGCTQPSISYAEGGTVSLGLATLQRIANALGCDLTVQLVSRD
jgi:transcriptional regulator with XRE-family HTH domain